MEIECRNCSHYKNDYCFKVVMKMQPDGWCHQFNKRKDIKPNEDAGKKLSESLNSLLGSLKELREVLIKQKNKGGKQ